MAEEDTEEEVEAALAVYGGDCTIIQRSPPHLNIRLQPRTAYNISQQFVEAVLVIKASPQYPSRPPMLELRDTKGLEEGKSLCLLSALKELAGQLISNPMLVAICEAALDRLTEMNQPDGNCCFCMEPLVTEDDMAAGETRPFMKLLSCFHCFHSDCFVRWWRWVLQNHNTENSTVHGSFGLEGDKHETDATASCEKLLEEVELKCPVCRKSIKSQDVASLWHLLAADSALEQVIVPDPEIMYSQSEAERKARFDEVFQAQQSCGGIIEPKKLEVLLPGMFVHLPSTRAPPASDEIGPMNALSSEEDTLPMAAMTDATQSLLLDNSSTLRLGRQEGPHGVVDSGNTSNSSRRFHNKPQMKGRRQGLWIKRSHH